MLFHSPGSCSNGILFLLHELGVEHVVQIVDVRKREQISPHYLDQNPKGKVPALLLPDGSVLTEFQAIALWLGSFHPERKLWPDTSLEQARMMEMLDFIVGTIHMRGFVFLKVPGKFHSDPDVQEALRIHGREQIDKGLAVLSQVMGDADYLLGSFSLADAALFYILNWVFSEKLSVPQNLADCHARLWARTSIVASHPLWG